MSEHLPKLRKWVEQEELLIARLVIAERRLLMNRNKLVEVLSQHAPSDSDIQEATRKAVDSSMLVDKLKHELEEAVPF